MEVISNKIFFNQSKNILFQLQEFEPYYYRPDLVETKICEDIVVKKKQPEYFRPKQRDTLFWCFYIAAYGYDQYLCVMRNYGVKELEIKHEASEYVKSNYKELKESSVKMTKSLAQDMMSDFHTSVTDTNFHNFLALCFMKKINVYILHEEKPSYLKFFYHKDSPTYLFQQEKYNRYSVQLEAMSLEKLIKIETDYYCLDSWIRPIRAISSYKVTDLEDIAYKTNLIDIPNMKKPDLYAYISESLSWY